MKIIILLLMLCASTLAFENRNAYEVSEQCQLIYKDGQFIAMNKGWCDYVIEVQLRVLVDFHNEGWCVDSAWTIDRWKSRFLIETTAPSEKTVKDVIKSILNKKHKCNSEVI